MDMDDTIKKTRISGRGRCFSIGGALEEFGRVSDGARGHLLRMSQNIPGLMLAQQSRLEVDVHGGCIGAGIELAAFAGRVRASKNSFFHLPELSMGLIPGAGGTVSILRRIGRQRLAYLVLSGKRLNVKEALAWGLVDEII